MIRNIKFEITILETGDKFLCQSTESVLGGMIRLGKQDIPTGCRGGGCGVCKVLINHGNYECKKMSRAHVSELEEQAGFVLACRCQPRSDLSLQVIGKMKKSVVFNSQCNL